MTPTEFDWSVDPECRYGYSEAQLREQLGSRYPAFEEYMLMKASARCTGPQDAVPSFGPARTCDAAHGLVSYVHDVLWFVEHAQGNSAQRSCAGSGSEERPLSSRSPPCAALPTLPTSQPSSSSLTATPPPSAPTTAAHT